MENGSGWLRNYVDGVHKCMQNSGQHVNTKQSQRYGRIRLGQSVDETTKYEHRYVFQVIQVSSGE